MPQAIPNSNHTLPVAHESSALRSPRDSDDSRKQWKRARITNAQEESTKQAINLLSRQVEKIRRRILGGAQSGVSGWYWNDNQKLYGDPTVNNYSKNQVVKILETDSIVTTGIVCAGSATAVKATAGKWVCLQDVPTLSATDSTNNNPAYIPAIPAVSGSLNPDNAGNYWEFLTPSSICVNGATIAI